MWPFKPFHAHHDGKKSSRITSLPFPWLPCDSHPAICFYLQLHVFCCEKGGSLPKKVVLLGSSVIHDSRFWLKNWGRICGTITCYHAPWWVSGGSLTPDDIMIFFTITDFSFTWIHLGFQHDWLGRVRGLRVEFIIPFWMRHHQALE